MLRLQRHLLGELLTAFVLVLLVVVGIIVAGGLLQILRKFPELSVFALVQAVPLLLALALPVAVPLSYLMACLLSYGRFADDNEFLAFQMGGLSPWHAVAPGICAAAIVSAATLYTNTDVNPAMTNAKNQVLHGHLRQEIERMRDPGRSSVRLPGMEMSWNGRDGERFRDVLLTWTDTGGTEPGAEKVRVTRSLTAEGATVKFAEGSELRLVVTLDEARMPTPGATVSARQHVVVIGFDEEDALTEAKGRDEMRASELYYQMVRREHVLGSRARQTADWRTYHSYAAEYWRRIALGLAPLTFALIGVPLGLVVRRGSRAMALIVALGIALPVYYPLLLWGENLARAGGVPAPLALNLGNLLLAGTGLVLVGRLVTR